MKPISKQEAWVRNKMAEVIAEETGCTKNKAMACARRLIAFWRSTQPVKPDVNR